MFSTRLNIGAWLLQLAALPVFFLPVDRIVRNLTWRGVNLASPPLLYTLSLYSEAVHSRVGPAPQQQHHPDTSGHP